MVDGTNQTSTQWAGQLPIWSANPLDLVNEKTPQSNNALWAVKPKSFIDNIIRLIAKMTWNPDPFTWKGHIVATTKPEVSTPTQAIAPEVKLENQPVTATAQAVVKAEEWWLFGKFTWILENIWNKVEIAWEKALWSATNAVNKWLETAWAVWEQAVNQAQQVAKQATENVNEFVKLEEPKKEWATSIQQ